MLNSDYNQEASWRNIYIKCKMGMHELVAKEDMLTISYSLSM